MGRKEESPTCVQMFTDPDVLVERLPGTISMTVRWDWFEGKIQYHPSTNAILQAGIGQLCLIGWKDG